MKMYIINARKLANYIQHEIELPIVPPIECPYKEHIGAIFTDIILQSGVNYRNVVVPRVNFVLKQYPQAFSVKEFYKIILKEGISKVLKWKHPTKQTRMLNLIFFCLKQNINTTSDITNFLHKQENRETFLKINGVGNKTLDYLLKILSIESVAVDRHIFSLVKEAGIPKTNYQDTKKIVEYAADLMSLSRRTIDYSIWLYMSNRHRYKRLLT